MNRAPKQPFLLGFASASVKGLALPTFVMASLLVGAPHAQAERNREFITVDGKRYCFGFDGAVSFDWPGGGGGLQPGERHNNGNEMPRWKYDQEVWWKEYGTDKKGGEKADLAKKLSKQEGFEDAAFVFLAGTGNQPNAYVRGARKDSYLSQKNPGDYVFFSEQVFSSSKAKYVAYKCNIESNVPEGMLGYALSDVQAGMVNPVF